MFDLDIVELLQNFIVLFTAITIHEFSHGWVAHKLGDPTAKSMGRLTLNPLAHLDPLGALMMVFCRFGWAKPVPVNPYYFKEPKKDMVLVSFAGPLSNIVLSFVSITIYTVLYIFAIRYNFWSNAVASFFIELFWVCAIVNVNFAVFNLIPFPPRILKRTDKFSPVGVSIAGGVSHNAGQIAMAILLMRTSAIGYYLPVLAVSGTVSGILVGAAAVCVLKNLRDVKI